jgi:hypothetical protein
MQWWFNNWTELMFPLEKESEVSVYAFNNFRTTSTAEVNEIFTALQNSNAPQYILINLLREYYNSIGETEKFKIVNKYYLYKSDDMTIKKGSLGYYDKIHIVISDNIMKWVDDEGIMDMNDFQLDAYLREKAKSLMAMPVDSNGNIIDINYNLYEQLKEQTESAGMQVEEVDGKVVVTGSPSELGEVNIANLPSANKLRETVGGLQGVIEIAKAVASGMYDLEAGITLISSLYGISIEEAKQWLGTPNIASQKVLDNVEAIVT